jgi:hypothetical protein
MNTVARAHFDGRSVVLDEPLQLQPGDELIVVRRGPPSSEAPQAYLQRLAAEQGVSPWSGFDEQLSGIPAPPSDEADLWEVIASERRARRRLAQDHPDPDLGE